MKYFQKVSWVCVILYLLNNEPTGCWHRDENKKGDQQLSEMPFQGLCQMHNSNQWIAQQLNKTVRYFNENLPLPSCTIRCLEMQTFRKIRTTKKPKCTLLSYSNANSIYPNCINSRKSQTHENFLNMLHEVSKRLKIGLAKENVPFNEYWRRCLSKTYQVK